MARGINKVILIGNLGADPEVRYTPGGTAVGNFNLATNESYKDREGNTVDKTEWHRIVVWERLAEICGEYLKKGSQVYIEGSLQTRSYEDKDGVTKYTTEIKAREMQILGSREGGGRDEDFGDTGGSRGQSNGRSQGQSARGAAPSGGRAQQNPGSGRGSARDDQGRGSQRQAPVGKGGGPDAGFDDSFTPDDDLPF